MPDCGGFFPPDDETTTLSPALTSSEIICTLLSSETPSSISYLFKPVFVCIHIPCLSYFLPFISGVNLSA